MFIIPFIVSFIFYLYGYFQNDPLIISIASMVFSIVFCYKQFRKTGFEGIDPIILYVFFMGLTALGNYMAIASAGTENEDIYYIYVVPEYILPAVMINYWGVIAIVAGYKLGLNVFWFPEIKKVQINNKNVKILFFVALLVIFLVFSGKVPSLGAITSYILLIPVLIIFFLSRYGMAFGNKKAQNFAFILAIIAAFRAVLFDFLRMKMILPFVSYALGTLMGAKSFKILNTKKFYVLYGLAFLFISYFSVLGQMRGEKIYGFGRFSALRVIKAEQALEKVDSKGKLMSRVSNLNQLTNIFDLVGRNGYYDGSTLEYMAFAFIPRFIWPGKPIIAKGRWFALEIGQAIDYGGGVVNNSINMTIPGELYLNYSYLGLFIGCFIFGFLIAQFWNTTPGFWEDDDNLMGNFFGFYLLFLGLFSLGADLQAIVTVTAIYLLTLAASKVLGKRTATE